MEDKVVKVPIVAMVIAAGMVLPAPARSQVSVNVSIGQPPPVIVAQPVLVSVQASPVYYAPSYGPDLFFYDGRYYLSLIHISEPTRLLSISYAVFCLKKKTL